MARAKVGMSQIGYVDEFDIQKIKDYLLKYGIIIPEEIKTEEELKEYLQQLRNGN